MKEYVVDEKVRGLEVNPQANQNTMKTSATDLDIQRRVVRPPGDIKARVNAIQMEGLRRVARVPRDNIQRIPVQRLSVLPR
jgi:hypothetical protein